MLSPFVDVEAVPSDGDLLFDATADDADEAWVNRHRTAPHSAPTSDDAAAAAPASSARRPTDAVLSCPGCFTELCHDCQRHAIYPTQYRAMFVTGCEIVMDQLLHVPREAAGDAGGDGGSGSKRRRRRRRKEEEGEGEGEEEGHFVYRLVRCEHCGAQVGMYDSDQVYHFFHVLADF